MIRLEVLVDAALMWSPTCKCKVASLFSSWSLNQLLSKQRIVNQVRYILLIFSVFLFSLTVISCKSSDDDVTSSASSSSDIVSVSDSGGYIQIESTNHSLDEGDVIRFTTTDTLPTGLALATDYYVVGTTANTFFVSISLDGVAVIYTYDGIGTGTHSWQRVTYSSTRYTDILDDLDDTLDGIKKNRRVIIEINYE